MVDLGVEKDFPLGRETVALIEPEGVSLGIEHDFRQALLCGPAHKFDQEGTANPAPAPIGEYRHAPDVPAG